MFNRQVDFFVGDCFPFCPEQKDLGGSEVSLVKLSEIFSNKYNFKVRVFIHRDSFGDERTVNNVEYVHSSRITENIKFDIVILWRYCGIDLYINYCSLHTTLNCNLLCIDCHDNLNAFHLNNPSKLFKFENEKNCIFLLKSNYHTQMNFIKNLNVPTFVCPNGVDKELYKLQDNSCTRKTNRFCYTSSYDRGLKELLLFSWRQIKRLVPEAELHVYYGMSYLYDQKLKNELTFLLANTPGVYDHGRASSKEISIEKQTSTFWLYPSHSQTEIDCINVRESLISGCIPIISEIAVLKERDGVHVSGDPMTRTFHDLFALTCVKMAKLDASELQKISQEFYNTTIKSNTLSFTWHDVALKWIKMFFLQTQEKSTLCELMTKYYTDKCPNDHNYSYYYYHMFFRREATVHNVFEMGIGHSNISFTCNMSHIKNYQIGSSLKAWREFFPNATIYGADINAEAVNEAKSDRIVTFEINQLNGIDLQQAFRFLPDFDLIIDDGYHDFNANVCMFENCIKNLKKETGIYVIEDVRLKDLPKFIEKIKEWQNLFPKLIFRVINIPRKKNIVIDSENYIIIIGFESSFSEHCKVLLDAVCV
jgi:hypothetical protein